MEQAPQAHRGRLSPEFILLGFLCERPSHGYELYKQLRAEFGATWHLSQSQTYNIIKRLLTKGDIHSTEVEQAKLPARQLLELTERGRDRFETWLVTPTNCSVHAIRVEFITRLFFIQKYHADKIQETIQSQQNLVVQGLAQLKKIQQSFENGKPFSRLALVLRIQLLESILVWLKECKLEFTDSSTKL